MLNCLMCFPARLGHVFVLFPGMSPHLGHDPITRGKHFSTNVKCPPPPNHGVLDRAPWVPLTDLTG